MMKKVVMMMAVTNLRIGDGGDLTYGGRMVLSWCYVAPMTYGPSG
jgi:hypothetical protein